MYVCACVCVCMCMCVRVHVCVCVCVSVSIATSKTKQAPGEQDHSRVEGLGITQSLAGRGLGSPAWRGRKFV